MYYSVLMYCNDWLKGGTIALVQNTNYAYLVTYLTNSNETLPTHAYLHDEQICLKNL